MGLQFSPYNSFLYPTPPLRVIIKGNHGTTLDGNVTVYSYQIGQCYSALYVVCPQRYGACVYPSVQPRVGKRLANYIDQVLPMLTVAVKKIYRTHLKNLNLHVFCCY